MTKKTSATTERQQRIQQEIESRPDKSESPPSGGAAQAGAHAYPETPFPEQHQPKPGSESQLEPRPQFLAPEYYGSSKLSGKVALITGGDSGIGRAVAVLFAREGADVAIVYLSEHEDANETKRYVEEEGQQCLLIEGDVRDPAFCKAAVEKVISEFGKLSILVNNAAFQEHAGTLEDITEEHFDETIHTNVYGYFHMAKAALPHLQSGDCIINTGSETGLFGHKTLLDYSMTKGAIHAFTQALASNVVKRGIRVNAVAPGPVWTPFNPADQSAEKISKFGEANMMGRPAQPEELAPAYVFLASPVCSSYVNGAILPVMGGPTPH